MDPRGAKIAIREALDTDMPIILKLEAESWQEAMRHSEDQLLRRVESRNIFVLELNGQVMGSITKQRINSLEKVLSTNWQNEDSIATKDGELLQLLRVNTLMESAPEGCKSIAVGAILRDYCLEFAVSAGCRKVCAVTKTTDYTAGGKLYQEYVKTTNTEFLHPDRGLNFHISAEARVAKVIPGWRNEDLANEGHGVLVVYDLRGGGKDPEARHLNGSQSLSFENIVSLIVGAIQEVNGIPLKDINEPIMAMGLDSLDLNQLKKRVSTSTGFHLSPTAIFNYPTVHKLARHISKESSSDSRESPTPQMTGALTLTSRTSRVAVIGMSCLFSRGVEGPAMFWNSLLMGDCLMAKVPLSRWDVDARICTDSAIESDAG